MKSFIANLKSKISKQFFGSPRKIYYNIVEVTLAISIIGLGAVSIVSLFPVGLQATRDAVGDNNAGMAADNIVSYIKEELEYNGLTSWNDMSNRIATSKSVTLDASPNEENFEGPWTDVSISPGLGVDSDNNTAGVFRIRQGIATGITDYSAIVRVWRSSTGSTSGAVVQFWDSSGTPQFKPTTLGSSEALKLNIELSWPSEKPYSRREKRLLNFDVVQGQ